MEALPSSRPTDTLPASEDADVPVKSADLAAFLSTVAKVIAVIDREPCMALQLRVLFSRSKTIWWGPFMIACNCPGRDANHGVGRVDHERGGTSSVCNPSLFARRY